MADVRYAPVGPQLGRWSKLVEGWGRKNEAGLREAFRLNRAHPQPAGQQEIGS